MGEVAWWGDHSRGQAPPGRSRAPSARASTGSPALVWYILVHMKQLLIEIDEDMATQLERVAPTRSRRRSEFIRAAIRRALWELEERGTAQAYARQPDSAKEAYLDATVWEASARSRPRPRRRR